MAEDNLLVTGSWGEPHVTSSQQRNFNSGILGTGQFVMRGMGLTVEDANTVKLAEGFGVMNGADVEVPAGGLTLKIDSGTQGQNRNDLVVLRYERDESGFSGIRESVTPVIVKGVPADGEASDPETITGNILEGDDTVDMPLWRVPISGLTPGEPERLYKELPAISWPVPISLGGTGASNNEDARDNLDAAPKSHGHTADEISDLRSWLLSNVFKVGYVWVSYVNASPSSIVGGTWTPITGRFPYFNSSTATGGSNTHTLTIGEMPAHRHQMEWSNAAGSAGRAMLGGNLTATSEGGLQSTGGGAAHNNMPAYQSLYAWRRTA